MSKISLLIPTKNRCNNIKPLFTNIRDTASSMSDLEIFFIRDVEDIFTLRMFIGLPTKNCNISFLARKSSEYLNRDYYNYMAEKSTGNYMWGIGDDIKFLTPNWNKILEEKIEKYLKDKPDRIAYISVNEADSQAKHPCFPLITKEAFQILGEYHCPQLLSWGSDRILWEIYNGINRTLHIPEISIKHLSYHDGSASFDETAKSMKERFFRNPNCHNLVSETIVPKHIQKLKEYISEKRTS